MIPCEAETYLSLLEMRRSTYTLGKTPSILTPDELQTMLVRLLEQTPSSFNSRSQRLVLLLGDDHDDYWGNILPTALAESIRSKGHDQAAVEKAVSRLDMFRSALGTVLFFEANAVVEEYQSKVPQYADKLPIFSDHASAMIQLNTWTSLTTAGYGANLQHYTNLSQSTLTHKYNLPHHWTAKAELVFGPKTAQPIPKHHIHDQSKSRLKVFGL